MPRCHVLRHSENAKTTRRRIAKLIGRRNAMELPRPLSSRIPLVVNQGSHLALKSRKQRLRG
jgi:hypothetical protein